MRTIADAAGVNIALLYRHFDSKDELISAAISEPLVAELGGALAVAERVPEYLGNRAVQRALTLEMMERLLQTIGELTPLLGVLLFSDRGEAFFTQTFEPAVQTLTDAAEYSRPQWNDPSVESSVVADMIMGTCLMYGIRSKHGAAALTPADSARHFCNVLFNGVASSAT